MLLCGCEMNGQDGHDGLCDRDRCAKCSEAYPLDTCEVLGGKTYCGDCGFELRQALRRAGTQECDRLRDERWPMVEVRS